MPALGERFRAAREARGLSLSDVSEQIRIRSIYLAAIEEENWPSIGAPVYIRGFLRTYARFLGLDPEEVVATFNGVPPPPAGSRTPAPSAQPEKTPSQPAYAWFAPAPPASDTPRRRGPWAIWAAALVAVLLVGFVVYNEWMLHRRPSSQVALASSEPSPLSSTSALPDVVESPGPSASPLDADDGPNTLALTLTAPSWLRVTVDGSVSMEGTFPAGTSKTFHGKSALVRIGNAGGVEIRVDGKDVGKLGNSGDVIERSFTL